MAGLLGGGTPGDGKYGSALTDMLFGLLAPKIRGQMQERDQFQVARQLAEEERRRKLQGQQAAAGLAESLVQRKMVGPYADPEKAFKTSLLPLQDALPKILAAAAQGYDPSALLETYRTIDSNDTKRGENKRGVVVSAGAGFVDPYSGKELYRAPEGAYTLSPGQSRFGGDNQQVASVAPEEKVVTQSPGSTIIGIQPGGARGSAAAPADPRGLLAGALGDRFQITSGKRTPEKQAQLIAEWERNPKGPRPANNSDHLSGNAFDIVVPGETPKQTADRMRKAGLPGQILPEDDHVHWSYGGRGAERAGSGLLGGARVISQGGAAARPATADEKAAYGIAADVPAQMRADGTLSVISGTGAALKPVPAPIQSGYVQNRSAMAQIDRAIAEVSRNPNALGLRNKLGDDVNQRLDPKGVNARAYVADIGSLKLHDRSGAAVTAAEQPRLMPFIPQVTDTKETALKKLRLLKEQYEAVNTEIDVHYGDGSGYRPMGGQLARPTGKAAPKPKPKPKLQFGNGPTRRGLLSTTPPPPPGFVLDN